MNDIDTVGGSIGCATSGVSTDEIAEGVGNGAVAEAGDGDDVAGFGLFDRRALDAAESENFRDASLFDHLAGAVQRLDALVRLDRAGGDAAGDETAEIGVGLEDRADHPERAFLDRRRRDMLQDQIEQRLHAGFLRTFRAFGHPALLGRAVENREIELLVGRVERCEQVEHLVDHLGRPRVGAVHLVDDDDRLQPDLQRLRDDELGLRQRAFGRVHQHQRAVHHVEDALDLAAEVGVAWRIDDVDARVLPLHGGSLGEDGDAALALQIVGVHRPLDLALVVPVNAGLLQQTIDEGGLAMVDVSDDGDVAQIHWSTDLGCVADPSKARCPTFWAGHSFTATGYALRRNIVRNCQKTTTSAVCWAVNFAGRRK